MTCGCQTACGCTVQSTNDNATVQRIGDTFYITVPDAAAPNPQNLFIQETSPGDVGYPYVWIELLGGTDFTMWIETGA